MHILKYTHKVHASFSVFIQSSCILFAGENPECTLFLRETVDKLLEGLETTADINCESGTLLKWSIFEVNLKVLVSCPTVTVEQLCFNLELGGYCYRPLSNCWREEIELNFLWRWFLVLMGLTVSSSVSGYSLFIMSSLVVNLSVEKWLFFP